MLIIYLIPYLLIQKHSDSYLIDFFHFLTFFLMIAFFHYFFSKILQINLMENLYLLDYFLYSWYQDIFIKVNFYHN
jgi:hypothetical protein